MMLFFEILQLASSKQSKQLGIILGNESLQQVSRFNYNSTTIVRN